MSKLFLKVNFFKIKLTINISIKFGDCMEIRLQSTSCFSYVRPGSPQHRNDYCNVHLPW